MFWLEREGYGEEEEEEEGGWRGRRRAPILFSANYHTAAERPHAWIASSEPQNILVKLWIVRS